MLGLSAVKAKVVVAVNMQTALMVSYQKALRSLWYDLTQKSRVTVHIRM
jgi:hypothetical protein